MSYSRFNNTLSDLEECYEHMEDELTAKEDIARGNLLALCKQIVADYGDDV